MPRDLDLCNWPRFAAFEHFRRLGQPYFSLCARVDVSALHGRIQRYPGATLFLAYHHAALRAAQAVEAFRYRLDGDRVRVYEQVDGSMAVLREDESLGFAHLDYEPDFAAFVARALPALAAARRPGPGLGAVIEPERAQAQIHMTTIPWLAFSSFSHARDSGGTDSVPKLAFGKIVREGAASWMPVAVEVHHALMDGLQVGRYYEILQRCLQED